MIYTYINDIFLSLLNWPLTHLKISTQAQLLLFFWSQESIQLWFEKCQNAHDLWLLFLCSTLFVLIFFFFFLWHTLIKIFNFFFGKGNKALPLSSFKFNDQRLGEWARCEHVREGGRKRRRERGGMIEWVSDSGFLWNELCGPVKCGSI